MGTRVLAFRLWETVPTWSHPLLPPFSRRIDCLVRLLEWEWLDILVKKKKKKGHEIVRTYRRFFFLSLFISFFFFRSPVVLGQECKVRYRSVAFKQVFEGLEGLSLSMRETNSRRTGENVRNPHSFGGIARFVIFFPNNLISRRGRILGKCSLSLSLSASFEMWRILELTSSQQDKGNGLVDMHTGIQYLRGIFRSSSFARHAYLICRYEYETWCFSIPYTIRSRKKKKKEKRKGEKNQFAARENERTTV